MSEPSVPLIFNPTTTSKVTFKIFICINYDIPFNFPRLNAAAAFSLKSIVISAWSTDLLSIFKHKKKAYIYQNLSTQTCVH